MVVVVAVVVVVVLVVVGVVVAVVVVVVVVGLAVGSCCWCLVDGNVIIDSRRHCGRQWW